MQTLLLTRSQVRGLLEPSSVLDPLRDGFVSYSRTASSRAHRYSSALPGPGTATVLFPGTMAGIPAYTVKVHAKFPNERPAIRGVLCLHDSATGALLAIMDSTFITAVRTGLAGALAAHTLARADADTVAVIGAGVQGTHQLRTLAGLRRIRQVHVHDIVHSTAQAFATNMERELDIPVEVAPSVASALREAGIVLVATWSKSPFIDAGMVAPGTHINSLGADEPGKAEVGAELIRSGSFFCDDGAFAVEQGALGGAGLGREALTAELGEVLAGVHPGRTSADQMTVYGSVGLPFQDVVVAWHVYERARMQGAGRGLDFLA